MATQKYLFLYRNPPRPADQQPSPEQMQEMMKTWHEWKAKFKNNIIDLGDGLKPTGKVLKNGVVSDGPFIESKEVMGGYSIVQAENYEHALEVARTCPITMLPGYNIEIRELANY